MIDEEILNSSKVRKFYVILAYFPGDARVFIYPNLIVICVPSLTEIAHLDGIFSIITSTLLGGTLPISTYCTSSHQLFSGVPNSKHLYIPRHQVTNVATNMLQTVT
jgi:hypothetical protein